MGTQYNDLLRRAFTHTNYNVYLALSWSMLFVVSGAGRYRSSVHPNEPVGFVVFCYALLVLWAAMIFLAVRARIRARRMVRNYLASAQQASAQKMAA